MDKDIGIEVHMTGEKLGDKKGMVVFAALSLISGLICIIISTTISNNLSNYWTPELFLFMGLYYWSMLPLMAMGIVKDVLILLVIVSLMTAMMSLSLFFWLTMATTLAFSKMGTLAEYFLLDSLWNNTNLEIILRVQEEFQCCGVHNFKDWKTQLPYYQNVLPNSCCYNHVACTDSSNSRHIPGCLRTYTSFLSNGHIIFIVLSAFFFLNNFLTCTMFLLKSRKLYKNLQIIEETKTVQASSHVSNPSEPKKSIKLKYAFNKPNVKAKEVSKIHSSFSEESEDLTIKAERVTIGIRSKSGKRSKDPKLHKTKKKSSKMKMRKSKR